MTRRPVAVRIRARKPEVLLRLRLVPPKVRFVMDYSPPVNLSLWQTAEFQD